MGRTLAEKVWDAHVVTAGADGTDVVSIDTQRLRVPAGRPSTELPRPGTTLACDRSAPPPDGAFGVLALALDPAETASVLADGTLHLTRPRMMRVTFDGTLPPGGTARALACFVMRRVMSLDEADRIIEFDGEAITALSVENRMTLCRTVVRGGARAAIIAPDDVVLEYLRERAELPSRRTFESPAERWSRLATDFDAEFDDELYANAATVDSG